MRQKINLLDQGKFQCKELSPYPQEKGLVNSHVGAQGNGI